MINLENVPLYAPDSWPNRFWTAQRNTTEWSVLMRELTVSGNAIARLMLQALAPTLHGAHLGAPPFPSGPTIHLLTRPCARTGLFDSHSLFTEMFNEPQLFLNGTAPLNVTGAEIGRAHV